jgi:hypothetical protein
MAPYDRLIHAFDIAWPRLLSTATDRGLANDTALGRLADVTLLFDRDSRSPAEIAEAALRNSASDFLGDAGGPANSTQGPLRKTFEQRSGTSRSGNKTAVSCLR